MEDRGIADARRVGERIEHEDISPALILCSTAMRTRQTWDHVSAQLSQLGEVRYLADLYSRDAAGYLAILRESGAETSVMIIGHNPMMEELSIMLAGKNSSIGRITGSRGFPTAGLASYVFDGQISDLRAGKAEALELFSPKPA